ncbi:MAG: hypothetical protein OIF48_12000 [Silicimonas sp.]|nr:hypothetical protein [Silicimonas sp.]
MERGSSPSAELYFSAAMCDGLETGEIRALSATVFAAGDTLVVIRHLSGLGRLPEHRRLIYVIDDDWRAGLQDQTLPRRYRLQLTFREGRVGRWLEQQADLILASTEVLLARLRGAWPGKPVELLEPAWPRSEGPLAQEMPRRLAYLSAATHRVDFRFIAPVLETLLSRYAVKLTVSENAPVPREWRSRPDVVLVPVMDWAGYRDWARCQAFDIALYPACATLFNAARSRNKLLEFDQFGAALLCSETWAPGAQAARAGRCLAVPETAEAWGAALSKLIETPGLARQLAQTNRTTLASEDPLKMQQKLWCRILGG